MEEQSNFTDTRTDEEILHDEELYKKELESPDFNLSTHEGSRTIFKINVANIPEEEVENYIRKVAARFKEENEFSFVQYEETPTTEEELFNKIIITEREENID